jgi:hypothetical protein
MWCILASVAWKYKRLFLLLVSDHSAAFPEEKIEEGSTITYKVFLSTSSIVNSCFGQEAGFIWVLFSICMDSSQGHCCNASKAPKEWGYWLAKRGTVAIRESTAINTQPQRTYA